MKSINKKLIKGKEMKSINKKLIKAKLKNYKKYKERNKEHEFLEGVFDGVALNRYDTATTSDGGLTANTTREPA